MGMNDMVWENDPVHAPRCVLQTLYDQEEISSDTRDAHYAERDRLEALIWDLGLKSYASGRIIFRRKGPLHVGAWEIYWLTDADAMALKLAWSA